MCVPDTLSVSFLLLMMMIPITTTQNLIVLLFVTSFVNSFCFSNRLGAMKRKSTFLCSQSIINHENKNFFAKYEGLGNDFILVDNTISVEPIYTPEQAVKICNRFIYNA